MVRGCQRSMIVLRDTDSTIYEEAYFLLRESVPGAVPGKEKLIEEANRIVAQNLLAPSKRRASRGRLESLLWYLAGLFCGIGLALLLPL